MAICSAEVVKFLVDNKYFLTAFELYHELQGNLVHQRQKNEQDAVLQLHSFFSDSSRFPPSELVKYEDESVDSHRELLKSREEQMGVLEYELRLAREDMEELQQMHAEEISSISKGQGPGGVPGGEGSEAVDWAEAEGSPSENDRRLLNCAVKAYLLARGYKLTALTFCDEVRDQDLDVWVGGGGGGGSNGEWSRKMPHEPLWSLYLAATARGGGLDTASLQELERVCDELRGELGEVKEDLGRVRQAHLEATSQASQARSEAKQLKGDLKILNQELEEAKEDLERVRAEYEELLEKAHSGVQGDVRGGGDGGGEVTAMKTRPSRPDLSDATGAERPSWSAEEEAKARQAIRQEVEAELQKKSSPVGDLIEVVSSTLPKIAPSVLIQKREDLLPVFLAVLRTRPESSLRDTLTHTLFNLIKKPNPVQRATIITGYVALAESAGEEVTAEELLPQCWSQLEHKYPERRALVADSCGRLAPHVTPELRGSLILSILTQILQDTESLVREAGAVNLALLLPLLPNEDKYPVVEQAVLTLAQDSAHEVASKVVTSVVPALTAWLLPSALLASSFMPALFGKIENLLRNAPRSAGTLGLYHATPRSPSAPVAARVTALLGLAEALVPHLRRVVLRQFQHRHHHHQATQQQHHQEEEEEEDRQTGEGNACASLSPPPASDQDLMSLLLSSDTSSSSISTTSTSTSASNVSWPPALRGLLSSLVPGLTRVAGLLGPRERDLRAALYQVCRALVRMCGEEFSACILAPVVALHAHVLHLIVPPRPSDTPTFATTQSSGPDSLPTSGEDPSCGPGMKSGIWGFADLRTWPLLGSSTGGVPQTVEEMMVEMRAEMEAEEAKVREVIEAKMREEDAKKQAEREEAERVRDSEGGSSAEGGGGAGFDEGTNSQAPLASNEGTSSGWVEGRWLCVLPLLLMGILPGAASAGAAVGTIITSIINGMQSPFEVRDEIVDAVGVTAGMEELQEAVVGSLYSLLANGEEPPHFHMWTAQLLTVVTPHLSLTRITQQVVPLVSSLAGTRTPGVRLKTIGACAAIVKRSLLDSNTCEIMTCQLDKFLEAGDQEVTVAVIGAITEGVAGVRESATGEGVFVQWAAEKLEVLSIATASSSHLQLGEAGLARRRQCATALLSALQAIVVIENVESAQGCIIPSLDALLRADDLFDEATTNMCQAMLKEQKGAVESGTNRFSGMMSKMSDKMSSARDKMNVKMLDVKISDVKIPEVEVSGVSESMSGWKEKMAKKFTFKLEKN